MIRRFLISALLLTLVAGCADDPVPPPPMGTDEVVSTPIRPMGPDVVSPDVEEMYTTTGATSSEGHPVQYRFDFDAEGGGDITDWSRSSLARKTWPSVGSRVVKAQARCEIHTDVVSTWSQGKNVEVGAGPETLITSVVNTYYIDAEQRTRVIDLTDGIADTVPYGSWITVFYQGIPSPHAAEACEDTTNRCLDYQVNYTRKSLRHPGVDYTIPWLPFTPEDTNLFGVLDSTSMNVGSVEYTVRARSVDLFDRVDMVPPEIEIIGNFDPTLDGLSLENYDGSVIGEGDTISWDWWNPANFFGQAADTLDFSDPANPKVVKEFYFVIKATGHDHPLEIQGSGVKSWKYSFERVGSNPPVFQPFARSSRGFVDGVTVDELSDTARVTFRYDLATDPGGTIILSGSDFLDKEYEYAVMGRDLSSLDVFDQLMVYDDKIQLVNSYNSADFGRWTTEGRQTFFLKLKR